MDVDNGGRRFKGKIDPGEGKVLFPGRDGWKQVVAVFEWESECGCGRGKRNGGCERNKWKQEEGIELGSIPARTGEKDDRRRARGDEEAPSGRNDTRCVTAATLRSKERIKLTRARRDRTLGQMPPIAEEPDEAEVTQYEALVALRME